MVHKLGRSCGGRSDDTSTMLLLLLSFYDNQSEHGV